MELEFKVMKIHPLSVVSLVPEKSYPINEMSDEEIAEFRNILDGFIFEAEDNEDDEENEEDQTSESETDESSEDESSDDEGSGEDSEDDSENDSESSSNGYK